MNRLGREIKKRIPKRYKESQLARYDILTSLFLPSALGNYSSNENHFFVGISL